MEVKKAVAFKHNVNVKGLLETFGKMVNECMDYALKHNIASPMKLNRVLYNSFKVEYGLATHYCISACRVACSIIRSWKRLVKRRRASLNNPPVFRNRSMRLQKELMRFKDDKIVITTRPYEWIEIPLSFGEYQKRFVDAWKRGEVEIGEITLLEDKAVVIFKKRVEEKQPNGYASIDVNLMSLDLLKTNSSSFDYQKIDLKKLYAMRVCYFEKRRKIQKLSKYNPKTSKRLIEKYSERERRKTNDLLHKITTNVVRELATQGTSPILEKLKGLNYNVTRNPYVKRKNRKISSLPYRKIQSYIEYKMAWIGYRTHYVSAKNTSKTCPRCGRLSKNNVQVFRCESCGYMADRHLVACVNMLKMWGLGFAPKALDEFVEREELRNESNILLCIST